MSMLGAVLTGQGKYAEAERLVVDGFKRMDAAPAPQRRLTRARIVKLYEAWGKPDKATEWRRR